MSNSAIQVTSADRPVWGREPVGGRLNMVNSSEDLTVFWGTASNSGSAPVVTANSITWDATSVGQRVVYQFADQWDSDLLVSITARYKGRGVRLVRFSNSPDTTTEAEDFPDSADYTTVTFVTTSGDPAATVANVQIQQTQLDAQRADTTYIEFVQVEFSSGFSGYQRTVGPYDITEATKKTLYYLANESDDFLALDSPTFTGAATVAYATEHGNYLNDGMEIADGFQVPMDNKLYGFLAVPGSLSAAQQSAFRAWLSSVNPGRPQGTDTHKATLNVNQSASDSVDLTITTSDGTYDVDWGDGTVSTGVASGSQATHTYSVDYEGPIVVTAESGIIRELLSSAIQIDDSTENLPAGLTYFNLLNTASTITGNVSDLPSGLTYFNLLNTASAVTGNVSDLPSGLVFLRVQSTQSDLVFDGPWTTTGIEYVDFTSIPSTTSQDIDDALAVFAQCTSWGNKPSWFSAHVHLAGSNPNRTSASDADLAAIIAAGGSVDINPDGVVS